MISAEELALGNYFRYKNFDWDEPVQGAFECSQIFKIRTLGQDYVGISTPFDGNFENSVDLEDIDPLEITPGILDALGFEQKASRKFELSLSPESAPEDDDVFSILLFPDTNVLQLRGAFSMNIEHVDSVHRLQNIIKSTTSFSLSFKEGDERFF